MIARFSDLMSEYRDDEYDLPDRGYADPERIKSLTAAKVDALRKAGPVPIREKKRRHVLRTVLLAAAFATLLSVTAYAVYQRTMADRVLEGGRTGTAQDGSAIVQYSAVGGSTGASATAEPAGAEQYATYADEKGTYYSSMGKNREYEAQKEWVEFYFSDIPLDARDLLDYSDPHRLIYGVGYGVLADKLDAIAEKYGLRLMQSVAFLDTEQEFLDTLALDSFYPADEDEQHTFCVYDDGSFEANGLSMALPSSETVLSFNVMRAVRGTLTDFLVLGGDPALADFETYTTASGTEVDIALEDTGSFLFADMENCHVTFWFYEGRREGLTLADLEAAADSIGFAALDEINLPTVAENVQAGMEQNMWDNPGFYREVTGKVQRVYAELGDYSLEGILPEGWRFDVSYANAVEDIVDYMDGLDQRPAPGPADYYDSIHLNYAPEDGESYAADGPVSLTYERYWGDPDRAVIRNAQAFHDRRETSISGPGYGWEPDLIPCAVGGFEGYCCLSNHYSGRVDARGTYLTWYDTDKELLFTLSTPMTEFSVQDTLALAADFAASIRDVPGTTPTGTVSDEVEDAQADVSELGVFGLTPPEGFAAERFYGEADSGVRLQATQIYANGGDPLEGYDRLLLTWDRVRGEDDRTTEDAFHNNRNVFRQAAQDAAQQEKEGYSFTECTVNGMEGFVYELPGNTGPTVYWLDGERDLQFTLYADNTLTGDSALFDADGLISLAQTVTAQ